MHGPNSNEVEVTIYNPCSFRNMAQVREFLYLHKLKKILVLASSIYFVWTSVIV